MADEIFDAPVAIETPTLPSMPDQYKEMQWDIRGMMEFYAEVKEKLDAIKAKLLEEMDAAEVSKWQGDILTFTRKADSSRETFDTKRFKAEHPDIYRQYTMITNTRGSVQITINK
jgi:predicted phage-related endonuclease